MVYQVRFTVFGSLLSLVFASTISSGAQASGKIYLNGHWAAAAPSSPLAEASASNLLQLQGPAADLRSLVRSFLRENASLLGTLDTAAFAESSIQRGTELETHRLNKSWKGIEVLGGEALVQLDRRSGQVAFASADGTSLDGLSAPTLSADAAKAIAFSSYRGEAQGAADPLLKVLVLGSGSDRAAQLVYSVTVTNLDSVSSDIHYIDARSGQEALATTNVLTLDRKVLAGTGTREDIAVVSSADAEQLINANFKLLYSDSGCTSRGGFSWWENWRRGRVEPSAGNQPCDTAAPDVMSSAQNAWLNTGKVHNYYLSTHRRDSVDGNGALIRSVVNFGGPGFRNAAWYNDRRIMLYGMGDGQRFNDFASSLDIVAHEITHGITANTANLIYSAESGALNESYSDVFGKLVDFRNGGRDWKLGKSLFRDGTTFIRDMENPDVAHNRDFKYRGQQCSRLNDFCGVHDNSGIPNKAATLIARRLGQDKLGKMYYLTLTQLLRSSSDFREARAQTEAACYTLFGRSSPDCTVVSEAFEAVGI